MTGHVLTVRELHALLGVAITQGYSELAVSVSSTDAQGYNFYASDLSEWVHIRDGRLYVVKATAGDNAASGRGEAG